jgi:hypothetical protein
MEGEEGNHEGLIKEGGRGEGAGQQATPAHLLILARQAGILRVAMRAGTLTHRCVRLTLLLWWVSSARCAAEVQSWPLHRQSAPPHMHKGPTACLLVLLVLL